MDFFFSEGREILFLDAQLSVSFEAKDFIKNKNKLILFPTTVKRRIKLQRIVEYTSHKNRRAR
jgi:hypothetical protein